jgi:alpha-ribazole phosphatase
MPLLFLIRHGTTQWNAEARIQGHANCPLNEAGRAQSQCVVRALAQHPIQAVYSSDLERAFETARAIAESHQVIPKTDRRLREASFGEWEGLTITEISNRWPAEAAAWRADSLHHRAPGGETLEAVQLRVGQVISAITNKFPEEAVAIVGHSGSLRAAVAYALGITPVVSRLLHFDNGSLTTLEYVHGRFSLRCLNDICHLRRV